MALVIDGKGGQGQRLDNWDDEVPRTILGYPVAEIGQRRVAVGVLEAVSPYRPNVANGILHVPTGRLIPFSPDMPLRHKLSVNFDPEAKCELFLSAFLEHILGFEDLDLLQRYLSQILLGQTASDSNRANATVDERQHICIIGKTGSGKMNFAKRK